MTSDLSITDRSTWVAILSVVAAVVTDCFHRDLSGYVSGAATLAAGTVVAFTLLAKHHYQAALVQEAKTVQAVAPAAQTVATAPQSLLAGVGTPGPLPAPQTVLEALQHPPGV